MEYKEIHAFAKASASGQYAGEVVDNLFDGGSLTQANTGTHPPGWFKLTWPDEMHVSKVRLQISQQPACETIHILFADDLEIHRWEGHTENEQWLEYDVDNTVKELKIETTKSKSWVAWKQLNVTGCQAKIHLLTLAAARGEGTDFIVTVTNLAGDEVARVPIKEEELLGTFRQGLAERLDYSTSQVRLTSINMPTVLDDSKNNERIISLLVL